MPPLASVEDLDDLLRARGLRATPQRRVIFEAVTALGHGTAEQVCQRVQVAGSSQPPAVNLSTVYRTLELLNDIGVVAHTHLGHGAPTYYPAAHADHLHLVCRRCGSVEEADLSHASPLADVIQRQYGFETDLTHLSLHGLCRQCAGDASRSGDASREAPEASER